MLGMINTDIIWQRQLQWGLQFLLCVTFFVSWRFLHSKRKMRKQIFWIPCLLVKHFSLSCPSSWKYQCQLCYILSILQIVLWLENKIDKYTIEHWRIWETDTNGLLIDLKCFLGLTILRNSLLSYLTFRQVICAQLNLEFNIVSERVCQRVDC